MSELTITSGRPRLAAVIRTRQPYVLFEKKLDSAYTVRLRYLSLNKGTDTAGTNEVLNFTNRNELPILPEEYHRLLMLCAGKIIAGELKDLTDKDGSPRYPGMAKAYQYYLQEYELQLQRDKEQARRRTITTNMPSFVYAGAEMR